MLLFTKSTKPVEINSEKPNLDKELESMNIIAKVKIILHSISFLRSEKLEFLE